MTLDSYDFKKKKKKVIGKGKYISIKINITTKVTHILIGQTTFLLLINVNL